MKTYTGLTLTLIMGLTILVYGIRQYVVMAEKSSVQINSFLDFGAGVKQSMEGFGTKENLNIAFAIGDFLSEEASYKEYLDYGTVNLYYEAWDSESDNLIPVKTRPCRPEDFQLDGATADPKFYEAERSKVNEFKRKMNILKCTEEPLNLVGNFQTETAKIALVMFERCDPKKRKTCKSEAEVKLWMQDKYLILAYNRQQFNQQKFGEERFAKTSYVDWLPLDINNLVMNRYSIQVQTLHSQDSYWPSPEDATTYWNVLPRNSMPYYMFSSTMINGIMIEMDGDTRTTNRTIYSLSNWAGEVGGFSSAVKFLIILLLPLVRNAELDSFLISRLYKQAPEHHIVTP